jgi:hypothetical protein
MAFWKEMRDAKADQDFVTYGRALHGPPPAVYNNRRISAPGPPCRISFKSFLLDCGKGLLCNGEG